MGLHRALSGCQQNVEAIAGFEPDLVVVSDDLNDVVASQTATETPVMHQLAAQGLEDTYYPD
jgi:iron complex transport system substrate-binding protein